MARLPYRLIILLVLCALWLPGASGVLFSRNEPVIQCYVDEPTADKPQSKVWFAAGHWWAWLPWSGSGSKIWRRGEDGQWSEEQHLSKTLSKLPKQADVYAEGNVVVAAMCQGNRLAVVRLDWNSANDRYQLDTQPLTLKESGLIETVTVDRDSNGRFWIAYAADSADARRAVVRSVSGDFDRFGAPTVLADNLSWDDICVIAAMDGAMGVLWSNQDTEEVLFSHRPDSAPTGQWPAPDTVASGNETADDHLNFCKPWLLAKNQKDVQLFAATKSSLDSPGMPLLAARVLNGQQEWINVEFAPLDAIVEPSRPIALWLGDHPAVAYIAYGANPKYNRPNWVLLQHFSPDGLKTVGEPVRLLGPVTDVNNVTGPKHEPAGIPVLLLASDYNGAVFEMFVEQGQ